MFFRKRKKQREYDDIHIVGCPKTRITKETFERIIEEYDKLPSGKWLFNLGNGNFGGQGRYESEGYNIINKVNNIKNCSNKKRMFEILRQNKVPSLIYYDLNISQDRLRAMQHIRNGGIICLRRRKSLKRVKTLEGFNRLYQSYNYATAQENKRYEYRVVMLKDNVVVVYVKNPSLKVFKYKQEYCTFGRITLEKNSDILEVCKQSTKALGIDICGIDVLVNKKGQAKIIEVNSGNGMAGRTIKKIMKML